MTNDHEWPELPAFEVTLRRRARIGLPASGRLGPDDPLRLGEGPGDVLVLRFAPTTRLRSRDPLHETIDLELAVPLEGSSVGPLSVVAAACARAGGEGLAFQSTHLLGAVHHAGRQGGAFVLDLSLRFVNPEVDLEHLGTRSLAGRVLVEV